MSNDFHFNGWIKVRKTERGFAVQFSEDGEMDQHGLGHAIAAVITSYLEELRKQHPAAERERVIDDVIDGVACGLEYNPEPLKDH